MIGKVAYARWPKGPTGKRVTSIWNWGFPINAAQTEKKKKATWLFIQWAASAETQARTAHRFAGPAKRSGVNRTSIWKDPEYVKLMNGFGDNFVEATMATLAGRHRRRLASARAAMAGDRRHHGDRDPVGAVGPGHHQGRARRRPAPRRTDDARLSWRSLRQQRCRHRGRDRLRRSRPRAGAARAPVRGRIAGAGVPGAAGDDDVSADVSDLDQRVPDGSGDAVRRRLCRLRKLPHAAGGRPVLVVAAGQPDLHRLDRRAAGRARTGAGAAGDGHEARPGLVPHRSPSCRSCCRPPWSA